MTSDQERPDGAAGPVGPVMLSTVVALRWRRPRLAADLAARVLAAASRSGDAGTWLRAAGWMLHGRAAVGDAREAAIDVLAEIEAHAGPEPLRANGSARLRVELAALAQANGDPDLARDLVEDWAPPLDGDDRTHSAELELDRLAVLVRCALVEGVEDLTGLRADVEAIGARVEGEAVGLVELLLGSIHRDDGEPSAAAARALRGLTRLGWEPARPTSVPTSPHLGCALLSQWVTAVLEAGTTADIPDGVKQLAVVDGGRHGVLWRLAVARAFAGRARPTADVLEDAAAAAAEVDAPSLEAACRSAQAELFEGAGHYRKALAAVRSAMAAERTDRDRARRLRDALLGAVESLDRPLAPHTAGTSVATTPPSASTESAAAAVQADGAPADGPVGAAGSLADGLVGTAGHPADGPTRTAGSALATLDLDLGGLDERAVSGATATAAVPSVAHAAVQTQARPVLDVGEIPVEPDATDATPLGDALLAELRATPTADPARSAVPTRGGGDDATPVRPSDAEVDLVIVLDLRDPSDGPLEHADLADVAADLVARAGRLVPPGSRVRGGGDAPGGAVATIAIPEAGEVVAALWARSLVAHVAGRVGRRGLPDGTRIRARVVGPDGRSRGAPTSAALTGPSDGDAVGAAVDSEPPSRDGGQPDAAARRPVAVADVRPGSGGRRRRATSAPDALTTGEAENGTGPGEPHGVTVNGAGRRGGHAAVAGVDGRRASAVQRGRSDATEPADAGTTPPGTGSHGAGAHAAESDGAVIDGVRTNGAVTDGVPTYRAAANGAATNGAAANGAAANGAVRAGGGRHGADAGTGAPFVPPEPGPGGRRARRRARDDASGGSGRNGAPGLLDGHGPPGDVPAGDPPLDGPADSVRADGVSADGEPFDDVRAHRAGATARRDLAGSEDVGSSPDDPADGAPPSRRAPEGSKAADPLDPTVPLTELDVVPVEAPTGARAATHVVTGSAADEQDRAVASDGTSAPGDARHAEHDGALDGRGSAGGGEDVDDRNDAGPAVTPRSSVDLQGPRDVEPSVGAERHVAVERSGDVRMTDAGLPAAEVDEPAEVGRIPGRDGDADAERSGTSQESGPPVAVVTAASGRDRRARPARRSTRGRRGSGAPANGADPTAIPDDLGLGDLLAGALAAYRDI